MRHDRPFMMRTLTREALSTLSSRPLSAARNATKADVVAVVWEGAEIVVKDFRKRGVLVRETIGRFSIARESRAYARLGGLAGVPAFFGRIDAHAFACALVPGRALPSHPRGSIPPDFFRALGERLAAIHGRGVAIADLHHRNVLVDETTGAPTIIDFSLALVRPASWNLPGTWLFERAERLDRIALERIRLRYELGASPSDARASESGPPPRFYAWGRALKRGLARIRGKRS
jgi:hypothetical protein